MAGGASSCGLEDEDRMVSKNRVAGKRCGRQCQRPGKRFVRQRITVWRKQGTLVPFQTGGSKKRAPEGGGEDRRNVRRITGGVSNFAVEEKPEERGKRVHIRRGDHRNTIGREKRRPLAVAVS